MEYIIKLPVSIGEAIDKLTILKIKIDKIKDIRKIEVEKEYNILYNELKDYIIKYNNLYNLMYKINLLIWNQMDILRDGELDDQKYTELCKKCIEMNDIRFRVKNKINIVSNSIIKEQKSYKINRIIIEINNNYKDEVLFNIIKYLSLIYDEVLIISSNKFYNFNDPTIKVINNKLCINFKKYIKINIEKGNILYKMFDINKSKINLIYDII